MKKGIATSKAFDAKYVGQTFTIKEKKAPAGYEIDDKTYTLVLGKDGVSLNLKDKSRRQLRQRQQRKHQRQQ